MIASHQRDLAIIRAKGIRPPWQLEDYTLQIDEARLLSAVADHQGLWFGTRETSAATTEIIGMTAVGNAKAVVARCHAMGYVTYVFVKEKHAYRIDLTHDGMYALEEWEDAQDD